MGWEHEADTVWNAQALYCVQRRSFDAVAEATGVAASTLKRWSEKYGWREKREELAKAEAEIQADKVLARSKTVKALLENPRADTAFAVAALEGLTLKEQEAARLGKIRDAAEAAPCRAIASTSDAVEALREAIERKLSLLLTRPENVDLRAVQDVQKCLALVAQLEAEQPETEDSEAGISANLADRIAAAMKGDL